MLIFWLQSGPTGSAGCSLDRALSGLISCVTSRGHSLPLALIGWYGMRTHAGKVSNGEPGCVSSRVRSVKRTSIFRDHPHHHTQRRAGLRQLPGANHQTHQHLSRPSPPSHSTASRVASAAGCESSNARASFAAIPTITLSGEPGCVSPRVRIIKRTSIFRDQIRQLPWTILFGTVATIHAVPQFH